MKRFIFSIIICLGLLVSAGNDAFAAKKGASTSNQTKIGLGISLNPTALVGNDGEMMFLPASMMNIYMPIQFNSSFRLEPEFGVYNQSQTIEYNDESSEQNVSFIRLGVGAFYTMRPSNDFQVYLGPRIGMLMTSSERTYSTPYDEDSESSQTIMTFGGSIGGEYFLSSNFSLGLEAQINYFSYGQPEEKPDDNSTLTGVSL